MQNPLCHDISQTAQYFFLLKYGYILTHLIALRTAKYHKCHPVLIACEMLENRVSGDLKRLSYLYLHPKAAAVVTEPDAYLIYIIKQRRGENERKKLL